jgi:hypothetical protein
MAAQRISAFVPSTRNSSGGNGFTIGPAAAAGAGAAGGEAGGSRTGLCGGGCGQARAGGRADRGAEPQEVAPGETARLAVQPLPEAALVIFDLVHGRYSTESMEYVSSEG